jgi:hypothetical protein
VNRPSRDRAESRVSRALYPALLLLVFIAPSQLSYAVHPRNGPFITPADVLLVLLVFIWLAEVVATRSWGRLWRLPDAVWAFLVVAILSATKAVDMKLALREILQFAAYFAGGYLLFADLLRRRHRLRTVVDVLTIATAAIVAWGVVDYVTQPDVMDVRASFGNRNVYSAYLLAVLPLLYGIGLHSSSIPRKAGLLLLVGIGAVTMLSGPLFWCLLVVLLAVSTAHNWQAAVYSFVGVGVLLAIMPVLLPRSYDAAFVELGTPYEIGEVYKLPVADRPAAADVPIVKKRWLEWQPALLMMAHNPVLGVGIGNYQLRIGEPLFYGYLPNVKKSEPDTNNLYLVIAASTGLAGLVCWVALLGSFIGLAEQMRVWAEDEFGTGLAAGLAASLGAIVIGNFFTSLSVRGTAITVVLILALIEVCAHRGWTDESGQSSSGR